MIDRTTRDRAVSLLEMLLADGVSNHVLDDDWPSTSQDRGVIAIGERIWCFYDDDPETILTRESFTSEELEIINRSLVFLKSDQEYRWPDYSFATENRSPLQRFVGSGKQKAQSDFDEFKRAGDFEAWPFLNKSEYRPSS